MERRSRRWVLFATLLMCGIAAAIFPLQRAALLGAATPVATPARATPTPSGQQSSVDSRVFSPEEQQQAKNYWTPERRANAQRREVANPQQSTPSPRPSPKPSTNPTRTPATTASPASPQRGSLRIGDSLVINPLPQPFPSASSYPVPYPFSRYAVSAGDLDEAPFHTLGNVYYRNNQTNVDEICNATVLVSDNKSVVWTAASCVFSPPVWDAANQYFIPGEAWPNLAFESDYDGNLGTWGVLNAFVLKEWSEKGNFRYDFGALVTSPNNGTSLTDAVGGGQQIGFNANPVQHWHVVSYMVVGQPPVICAGPYANYHEGGSVYQFTDGPQSMGMGCDKAGVGAGWIVNFGRSDSYLMTVASVYYEPNSVYGPYMDNVQLPGTQFPDPTNAHYLYDLAEHYGP